MSEIKNRICGCAISLSILHVIIFVGLCCHGVLKAQERQIVIPDSVELIADKHAPMEYVAGLLEQMYVKPVTYEDPILLWDGDTGRVPNSIGKMLVVPKRKSFIMPSGAHPSKTQKLDKDLLNKVVDAYHAQTDGPRFRVESSRWGLHLIPDQVRNSNGQFVKIITFLDTDISVPIEKRTPSGHLGAICDAINASMTTGVKLESAGFVMDGYYSQIRLSRMIKEEEKEQISFPWGIERTKARDALIDLLDGSATTLTWRLLCDTQPVCALNINPMEINYMGPDGKAYRTALNHDRKKRSD